MKTFSVLLLTATAAAAQSTGGPWAIKSSTLDGGGGVSTGGVWKVTGTIAQADATAGNSTGGTWSEQGGFWPGVVAVPGGPVLTVILASPTTVTISWGVSAIGYRLQSSPNLQTWTNQGGTITGASSIPWPTGPGIGSRSYFRLIRP